MEKKEYSARIVDTWEEMSTIERIKVKDLGDATKLNEVVDVSTPLLLDIANVVVMEVHNEKSENTDYPVYILIDENGERYSSGSSSLYRSLQDIRDEFAECGEKLPSPLSLKIYKAKSKNNTGYMLLANIEY